MTSIYRSHSTVGSVVDARVGFSAASIRRFPVPSGGIASPTVLSSAKYQRVGICKSVRQLSFDHLKYGPLSVSFRSSCEIGSSQLSLNHAFKPFAIVAPDG